MLLSGSDLASYIKERQVRQVRQLRAKKVYPKLAIVYVGDNSASQVYMKMKQKYGDEIKCAVTAVNMKTQNILDAIADLNDDSSVHGIIVQLPLPKGLDTDVITNAIAPNKDIDGLGVKAEYDPATAIAILWLLSGYNIELKNKRIALVGQGQLVGKPLKKLLERSGLEPVTFDEHSKGMEKELPEFDIIISASGQPGLITSEMVKDGTVVIDAGTAESGGKLSGDANPELYIREAIKISPVPGGVGPLTVAVLFENLIRAAG